MGSVHSLYWSFSRYNSKTQQPHFSTHAHAQWQHHTAHTVHTHTQIQMHSHTNAYTHTHTHTRTHTHTHTHTHAHTHTHPLTCKSFIGFQSCSKKMTVSAPVRLRPSPPTWVVRRRTSMDGSLLNLQGGEGERDGVCHVIGINISSIRLFKGVRGNHTKTRNPMTMTSYTQRA